MIGVAQHWYYMLERDVSEIAWSHFKLLCQQRFGLAVGTNHHLAYLTRLPFRSTVEEYQEAFKNKMAHTGYLSPEQQVQLFTGGLPNTIRVDVELQAPPDLQQAMALACAYEKRASALLIGSSASRSTRAFGRTQQASPSTITTTTLVQPSTVSSLATPLKPFKRFSPAEMMEWCHQGLLQL